MSVNAILTGKQSLITIDSTPTAESTNAVSSGGTKVYVDTGLSGKQDTLTFDSTPTAGSTNPVTSDGLYLDINADAKPYVFRQTGGGVECEDTEVITELTGGTVAWNQVVQNGNFADTNGWNADQSTLSASNNILTVTPVDGTKTYFGVRSFNIPIATQIVGHKYFCSVDFKATKACNMRFQVYNIGIVTNIPANEWTNNPEIIAVTSYMDNYTSRFIATSTTAFAATDNFQVKNCFVIDLTLMFGSTIADYIYTLETNTAGAGIAWLKKHGFIDGAYHAYDTGSIQSVAVTSHDTVGFNAWDEEWEVGTIRDADGENLAYENAIRAKNLIPVIPGASYFFKIPAGLNGSGANSKLYFYDANRKYLSVVGSAGSKVSTMSSGVHYIRFALNNISSYGHDICVNISDPAKNDTYEPYKSFSYPISPIELRGIPKLDANNKLYYDGDIYRSDGQLTRKYGIVDLGTLNWNYVGNVGHENFNATFNNARLPVNNNTKANILCQQYLTSTSNKMYSHDDGDKTIALSILNTIYVYDSAYSDSASFKAAMSGVYLVYELATPITESADPFTSCQVCDPDGTEEWVDAQVAAGNRDVSMPVQTLTRYPVGYAAKVAKVLMPVTSYAPTADLTFIPETGSAGWHNSIYRGKYLGDQVTAAQYTAINAGTFDDLFIGDYWTINNIVWRIAAFDYWLNCGDTSCTTHHVVIVPDGTLGSAKMNNSNVTTGAYVGSDFNTGNNGNTGLSGAKTTINSAFGSAHILSRRGLFANAVTDGKTSGLAWYDSTVDLMNEVMVYGCHVWGSAPSYETGIDKSQLALFALAPEFICNREYWWLRDVVSSARFACVNPYGAAREDNASASFGVRPAFAIKV